MQRQQEDFCSPGGRGGGKAASTPALGLWTVPAWAEHSTLWGTSVELSQHHTQCSCATCAQSCTPASLQVGQTPTEEQNFHGSSFLCSGLPLWKVREGEMGKETVVKGCVYPEGQRVLWHPHSQLICRGKERTQRAPPAPCTQEPIAVLAPRQREACKVLPSGLPKLNGQLEGPAQNRGKCVFSRERIPC